MRTVCCDSTSIQANLLGWTMTLEGVWCCCSSGACNGNLFTKKKSNQKLSSDVRRREHFGNTYNDFSRLLDGNVLGRTDLIPFLFKYKMVNCGNANNASAGMISMKFCSIFNVSNSKPRRIGNLIRRFLFKFKFRMLVRSGTSCSTSKSVNLFCDKSLKTDGNVCCFNKKKSLTQRLFTISSPMTECWVSPPNHSYCNQPSHPNTSILTDSQLQLLFHQYIHESLHYPKLHRYFHSRTDHTFFYVSRNHWRKIVRLLLSRISTIWCPAKSWTFSL